MARGKKNAAKVTGQTGQLEPSKPKAGSKKAAQSGAPTAKSSQTDDFIMTLDSDAELPDEDEEGNDDEPESESDEQEGESSAKRAPARLGDKEKVIDTRPGSRTAKKTPTGDLNPDFIFDIAGDGYSFDQTLSQSGNWSMNTGNAAVKGAHQEGEEDKPALTVDDIIERRRNKRKRDDVLPLLAEEQEQEEQEAKSEAQEESDEDDDDDQDRFGAGVQPTKGSDSGSRTGESDSESEDDDEEDPLAEGSEDELEARGDDQQDEDEEEEENEEASDSSDDEEGRQDTEVEKARKAAFFSTEGDAKPQDGKDNKEAQAIEGTEPFSSLGLSRPILRALTTLGFNQPTPIQSRTIPLALAGKDLVAGAVTGSGKTAAFMIPIVERLAHLYTRVGSGEAKSRVVILTPTRELGIQCHSVGLALAQYTGIRFSLIVGGLSVKTQEAELKSRPEVLIATPGRLIDHVRNTPGFSLEDIEILVMDEADRMLEDGFHDELTEIIRHCPEPTQGRQTMLFSATMTDDVDELVRLSLRKPVRLFVDPKRSTAAKLVQEFVRVRGVPGSNTGELLVDGAGGKGEEEHLRPALLLALCTRTFTNQVIIFVRSKKLAHQLRIIFGLLGLSAVELHGDLSQDGRLQSLQSFKEGRSDFMIATDLAARGLDIRGVSTVINYDMPGQFEQYLHRVGRTARAGRNGRAVTLVGQADRKMLKAALRKAPADQVKHRLVPTDVVSAAVLTLDKLRDEVAEVLQDEKEEKLLRQAEMELAKTENVQAHADEIYSRPARTWFQTPAEKKAAQEKAAVMNNLRVKAAAKDEADKKAHKKSLAGLPRKTKRVRLAREEDAKDKGASAATTASIRASKRAQRPTELGQKPAKYESKKKLAKDKQKKRSSTSVLAKKGNFKTDLTQRGGGGGGAAKAKSKGKPKGKKR